MDQSRVELWEHQDDAGHGCYLAEVNQVEYPDSTEGIEGVRRWFYLLDSQGSLTEME